MPASSHSQSQSHHPEEDRPIASDAHERGEETIRIPLAEESLETRVVERERGVLRIHRRVESEPIQTSVDLHQDHYVVDRVEVNELASERRDPWYEGETLVVPVYEEVLVTETRLMLRELLHLRNTGEIEQVNVRATLRREVIDIDEPDGSSDVSQAEAAGEDDTPHSSPE